MPVLIFSPETAGLVETLEFKSEVFTDTNGGEQRSRIRTAPRSLVELTVSMEDGDRALLNSLLYSAHTSALQSPSWWEAANLSENLAAGTRNVSCVPAYRDFQVGGYGLLWSSPTVYEVFQVGALASNHIQMPPGGPALQSTWLQRDTWAVPLKSILLGSEQGQTHYLMGLTEGKLKYTVLDNTDLRGAAPSAFPTYLGKPLFNRVNSAERTMSMGWVSSPEVFDPGNLLTQTVTWTRPKITQALRIVCKTQQAIYETRVFFHLLGGRQKSFWLGTGKNDMPPLAGIGLLQGYLSTANQGFVANYGAAPVAPRGHLQLVRTDGARSQHAIPSAAVISSSREDIGISPGSPMDLSDITRIARVEFLTLCRLREDTVKITHLGRGQAVFEADVVGVSA